ncbi:MAG TPA: ABC transporter substrate-binding protein [Thermodesulfovibrionales bacterium]|nr:ABC transporter substrate-binding protein [Thermodesulfovibrionales bacterium]
MKGLSLGLVLFFLVGLVAPNLFAADTFDLVIPLPLTGKQAKFGEMMKRSYEMAAEEINAKGGIKKKKIALSFEDSGGKPETARAIVEKLIDVKKQPIIVGEYTSACAKAAAAVAEERKTPYLIVASADDNITQQNYKYVFRQNDVNSHYADGLVSFMKDVVKPKTVAILYESSAFGTSGAEAMEKDAEKLGMKVLLKEKYEAGSVDFKPLLTKIKAAQPDVIYMISYVMDASLLMKQIKELRLDAKLFAGGAAGFAIPEFIENAKDAADYVVSATLWTEDLKYPGARAYADKYKAKYGAFPSYHGASAYSALFVVKNAIEKAKDWTPDKIRDALKTTDMMTAFGPIKFENKEGYQNQNFMPTLAIQVQKGQFETIWPEQLASKKYIYPIPTWRERR